MLSHGGHPASPLSQPPGHLTRLLCQVWSHWPPTPCPTMLLRQAGSRTMPLHGACPWLAPSPLPLPPNTLPPLQAPAHSRCLLSHQPPHPWLPVAVTPGASPCGPAHSTAASPWPWDWPHWCCRRAARCYGGCSPSFFTKPPAVGATLCHR